MKLGGVFDLGSGPGPTGGLALGGALIGRLWRVELRGLWLAPRTHRPDPGLDLGARVGLFAAGARGCVAPRVGPVELPVCGGLEAGALRGQGVGAALGRAGTDVIPWLAASVGPGLMWSPARWVAIGVEVDLVVALARPRFAVASYGDVYRGGRVAGRALLAVELRFR